MVVVLGGTASFVEREMEKEKKNATVGFPRLK